jgi:heme exporter protein D
MSWLPAAWSLVKAEFFPSKPRAALSIFSFFVALLTALGIFFKVVELPSVVIPDEALVHFTSYVWATFIVSCVFIAATSILMQRLLRRHEEINRLKEAHAREIEAATAKRSTDRALADRAMTLQHQMAETVRSVVAKKGKGIDLNACLDRVLGASLREYLRSRLGDHKINCTVKSISRPEPGAGFQLTDVFRDDGQSKSARPIAGPEPVDGNYIYLRFKNAGNAEDAKQVYLADVNSAGALRDLTARAHARGYRTVLAFPLNQPAQDQQLGMDGLIGFLGLDSPDPHAFDKFFNYCREGGHGPSNGSGDGVFKPLDELQFLYAIADSVATILMIVQRQNEVGKRS